MLLAPRTLANPKQDALKIFLSIQLKNSCRVIMYDAMASKPDAAQQATA